MAHQPPRPGNHYLLTGHLVVSSQHLANFVLCLDPSPPYPLGYLEFYLTEFQHLS